MLSVHTASAFMSVSCISCADMPTTALCGSQRKPVPAGTDATYSSPTAHGTVGAESVVRPSATTERSSLCHTWKGTPSGSGRPSSERSCTLSVPTARSSAISTVCAIVRTVKSHVACLSVADESTRSSYFSAVIIIGLGSAVALSEPPTPAHTSAPDVLCTISNEISDGSLSDAAQCDVPNSYETKEMETSPHVRGSNSVTSCTPPLRPPIISLGSALVENSQLAPSTVSPLGTRSM
eukprot:3119799-Pleurochrysis_carterae.AAC.1